MSVLIDHLPAYRRHLLAAGRSQATLKVYGAAIRSLASTYQGPLEGMRRGDIEEWLTDRRETVSATTVNIEYRAIRQFLLWATAEEIIDKNPTDKMKTPKPSSIPPEVLTTQDIERLMTACLLARSKFIQTRDQALLSVLWDCGLRRQELVNVLTENVDLDSQTIRLVITKNKAPRTVCFSQQTGVTLDRYLRQRAKHPCAGLPYLFIGQRGILEGNGLYQALREIEKRAGFPRTVRPHLFRHSWCHQMLVAGLAPVDLAVLAGWSDMQMMLLYGASAASSRAVEAVRRIRP